MIAVPSSPPTGPAALVADRDLRADPWVLRGSGAGTVATRQLDGRSLRDVVFDSSVGLRSGGPDDVYGILVRQNQDARFLVFGMTPAAQVVCGFYDGEFTPYAVGPLAADLPFRGGIAVANRFTAVCSGPGLTFALNGAVVLGLRVDPSWSEGLAGWFVVQGAGAVACELAIHWAQVRALLPGQPAGTGAAMSQ